jgi:hypothetical protein
VAKRSKASLARDGAVGRDVLEELHPTRERLGEALLLGPSTSRIRSPFSISSGNHGPI